ncbi:hypothetical protein C5K23_27470 [Shigella boydii]|nr:hypothetical protein C5K23_27470 [Shigella boydii]
MSKNAVCKACRGVSQYTLRYRYVTVSGLRPDPPKKIWLGDCQAKRSQSPNSFNRNRSKIGKKKLNYMIYIE